MQVEALSKALVFYDLIDVFQILDEPTVTQLTEQLEDLYACESTLAQCEFALQSDPRNSELLADKSLASNSFQQATTKLQATSINTTDLIKFFRDLDEVTIRPSNAYYVRFGVDYLVGNLAWSSDQCLNTCNDALRDKVREGLVGVSVMESGVPLVLKKTLELIMDVDDVALRSLTEALQRLQMKDVAGENMGTVVSYLKGSLLLLKN